MMKKCLELSNMDSLIVGNTYLEVRMRKHNGKKIIGAILLLVILVLVGNGKMQQAKADPLQPEIARKILRFHILANSDSEEDQAVKIKVRDALGKMMGPKLADSKNLEETKKIVSENMDEIVALAEKTLEDNGYTYGATAELAHVQFPEKNYGDYTFPAGEYEALEVTNKAVMEALDGLPPVKVHCSLLAEEAIHAALWDYAEKHGIKIEGLDKPKADINDEE